jgi:hypothetical protein
MYEKPNSERVKKILAYFDGKDIQRLRLDFCVRFSITEQTFFNKISNKRLPNSYISNQQADWLENWAKINGMPDNI